jgi:glucose-1-phosphate cytidylyltransferase
VKAVILAGDRGTRLPEETSMRPKPMVEIGGKPILWRLMKMYSAHGVEELIVWLGYRVTSSSSTSPTTSCTRATSPST